MSESYVEIASGDFEHVEEINRFMDGYLHSMEQILHQIIPLDIKQICIAYISAAKSYFTIYNEEYSELRTVNNNDASDHIHCSISRTNMNPFESIQILKSKPFAGYVIIKFISTMAMESGVHQLSFNCIRMHPNDMLGIISECDLNKLRNVHNNLHRSSLYHELFGQYRYLWWNHTGKVRYHGGRIQLVGIKSWRNTDNIRMIVDCDKWTLQFELDTGKSQPIDIEPGVKYYAALQTVSSGAYYLYNV